LTAAFGWRSSPAGRPVAHVAHDIGLPSETLRKAVRRAEADQGLRPDLPSSEEREQVKQLSLDQPFLSGELSGPEI
jgi:transposase-like protein